MSSKTNGQTAIITGASSGIGLGVAEAYVARGANVVLNARNETKLHEAAKRLGAPERIAVVAGDIGVPETGQRLVDAAVEKFGRVDVLLNNGGHFFPKSFADHKPAKGSNYHLRQGDLL